MVVISMTNCTPALRGDLSKWMCEISSGVYVGNINARVRDALWKRVCKSIKDGRATLVMTANTEQGFAFRVHNTTWEPVDYDGVTFMRKSVDVSQSTKIPPLPQGFSKASKYRKRKRNREIDSTYKTERFVILDLETTGLDAQTDSIVEIGAIKVENGIIVNRFSAFVKQEKKLPKTIVKLTGITDKEINDNSLPLEQAIKQLSEFIDSSLVVGYNIDFDSGFIDAASKRCDVESPVRKTKDVLSIARRKIDSITDFKLRTVASFLSIPTKTNHRALEDCETIYRILMKLNEF